MLFRSVVSVFTTSPVLALICIGIAAAGQRSATPVFWNHPAALVTGAGAAAALALINSVGNIGGFVGPYLLGFIDELTGSTNSGLLVFAACFVVAAVMALAYKKPAGGNKIHKSFGDKHEPVHGEYELDEESSSVIRK